MKTVNYGSWIAVKLVLFLMWSLSGCVTKSTFEAKEQEFTGAMTALERAQATSRKLSGDLERVSRERSVLEQDLDNTRVELRGTIAAKDREIAQLQKAFAESQEQISALKGTLAESNRQVGNLQNALGRADQELRQLRELVKETEQTVGRLRAMMVDRDQTIARLESMAAQKDDEIARLQRVTQQQDEEVGRLRNTHQRLVRDLKKEIEAGEIKVTQFENLLRVNMVEKILFDSGKAEIKPRGLEILKRVGGILKNSDGKQLRIEGHTDNVPIGPALASKFRTNWELSTARATVVARYFEDAVRIPPVKLAACGFGEYRPVATNDTDDGRAENRRIEILLAPLAVDGNGAPNVAP